MIVIGVDPGFAALGWAKARVDRASSSVELLDVGVIATSKEDKTNWTTSSQDISRRIDIIFREMCKVVMSDPVSEVGSIEALSLPRNSSAASKVTAGFTAVNCALSLADIPCVEATPKMIKEAMDQPKSFGEVNGLTKEEAKRLKRKQSKDYIREAVLSRLSPQSRKIMAAFERKNPKAMCEHAFDAVAAIFACMNSPTMKIIDRQVGRAGA